MVEKARGDISYVAGYAARGMIEDIGHLEPRMLGSHFTLGYHVFHGVKNVCTNDYKAYPRDKFKMIRYENESNSQDVIEHFIAGANTSNLNISREHKEK